MDADGDPNLLYKDLDSVLMFQQISFTALHFDGTWEQEIRSVKAALYITVGSQTASEVVLRTVLIEIESILNTGKFFQALTAMLGYERY